MCVSRGAPAVRAAAAATIIPTAAIQLDKVEHNYHDHAGVKEGDEGSASTADILKVAGGLHTRGDQNFPVKLHYMLEEMEADGMDDIVSWQPHGRCFVVHKQKEFVEHVLPLWFRQTKFPSFQRQLNLYGFKRLTTGRDKGGYYHEMFLRSKRFLAHRIQRIKVKGTGARKPSSPETEPNLYLGTYLPPSKVEKKSAAATTASSPTVDAARVTSSLQATIPPAAPVSPSNSLSSANSVLQQQGNNNVPAMQNLQNLLPLLTRPAAAVAPPVPPTTNSSDPLTRLLLEAALAQQLQSLQQQQQQQQQPAMGINAIAALLNASQPTKPNTPPSPVAPSPPFSSTPASPPSPPAPVVSQPQPPQAPAVDSSIVALAEAVLRRNQQQQQQQAEAAQKLAFLFR